MGKDLKGRELGPGIRQRKDNGKYKGRFVGRNGKRITVSDKKLPILRRKLRVRQHEDDTGIDGDGSSIRVREWSDTCFNDYDRELRHVTKKNYASSYRIINDYLGDMLIIDVKPIHIVKMINYLHEAGYANSTIRGIKSRAYSIFERASENTPLTKNPVAGVSIRFRDEKEKRKALTNVEQECFKDAFARSHYYEMFVFMLETGLRISEVLAVRENDIDMERRTIKIVRDFVYTKVNGHYTRVIDLPKSKSGIRTIPLSDEAMEVLEIQLSKKLKDKKVKNIFDDLVFLGRSGQSVTDVNIRNILRSGVKAANKKGYSLPHIHPHMLRYTFGTRCLEKGIPLKVVSQFLGHAKIDTTADIYQEVLDDYAAEEIKKLNIPGLYKVVKKNG